MPKGRSAQSVILSESYSPLGPRKQISFPVSSSEGGGVGSKDRFKDFRSLPEFVKIDFISAVIVNNITIEKLMQNLDRQS